VSARCVAWMIALSLHVVIAVGVAAAQTQLGGVNIEGGIEAGGRFYIQRPSPSERAKFEEYRDLSPGLVLAGMNLRLSTPNESIFGEFGGLQVGLLGPGLLPVGRPARELAVRLRLGPDASYHFHDREIPRDRAGAGSLCAGHASPPSGRAQQRAGHSRDRRALGQGADAVRL
jgi:hypothetical protein